MAFGDISLTAGMRSNLVSLQGTVTLLNRTQERLATGKKVNSALDNPTSYFTAKNHSDRASDLSVLKDGMAEAIQTVKAADKAIKAITELIETAKGLASSARSAGTTEAANLANQFNEILNQIDDIAQNDAVYRGTNLLDGDELSVQFNEGNTSSLTITGFNGDTAADGLNITTAAGSWATSANVDAAVANLDAALVTLRSESQELSANLSIVTARQNFTTDMINTLMEGSNNLTAADVNEEGANMLMLQTRQSLGTTALSLSSQAAQSVLQLF